MSAATPMSDDELSDLRDWIEEHPAGMKECDAQDLARLLATIDELKRGFDYEQRLRIELRAVIRRYGRVVDAAKVFSIERGYAGTPGLLWDALQALSPGDPVQT